MNAASRSWAERVAPDWFRAGSMLATFARAGLLAPLRPDKYFRIATAAAREGGTTTTGIAMAAQRSGDRPAIIDERGSLTYAELDRRCDALAGRLQRRPGRTPRAIAVMIRNHRGFIEARAAANRSGADVLLLNTSFAGPALAEVVAREGVDAICYNEEFTAAVDLAVPADSDCVRLVSWADDEVPGLTAEDLIEANTGRRPDKPARTGKLVMLTSGTTGTPKGARRSGRGGGGIADLAAIFDRIPWHTEETVV